MRAAGLQGDASPEIIEIIDDDTDAFGDRATAHTGTRPGYDTGGPRWVGPVAAVALVGLIGYGVATSASSGAPKAAPITSTSVAPTTTQPAPPTTVPLPLVPHYAPDPPREFTVQHAESVRPGDGFGAGPAYQLWATPGATATSGSWFSMEANAGGYEASLYAINAYRKQVGDVSLGISHLPGGHTFAQFLRLDGVGGTITSFGWSDDDLARLAASVTMDGNEMFGFGDAWFTADHQIMGSTHPWLAVQGMPAEQLSYSSSDDPFAGLFISVGERLPADEGGGAHDRQIALRFLLDHVAQFPVDGHAAVAGTIIGQDEYSLATWIAGDHIVTVGSTLPVAELVAIARTVHEVSSSEWEEIRFEAVKNRNNSGNGQDYNETQPLAVSFGTDAASATWTIKVSMLGSDTPQPIFWSWDSNGHGTTFDEMPRINSVVDGNRTYALADLPRTIANTAELHIFREGLDPVIVRFIDVNPEFDRTFAAYAFSESVPYTAQIIGPDGAVLATWPSP